MLVGVVRRGAPDGAPKGEARVMQSNRIQPFPVPRTGSSRREKPGADFGFLLIAATARVAAARVGTPRRGRARRAVQMGALLGVLSLAGCRGDELGQAQVPPPPEQLYGELFVAVQTGRIFEDQKFFVDATPRMHPDAISRAYAESKGQPDFDLGRFVADHFELPTARSITPPEDQSLRAHIDWLWPRLTRETQAVPEYSSLIPLPRPYVVPGGRFREGYYWDTYFSMLGLKEAGRRDLILDMVQNFAHQIDRFGHVPNGNRTYYLSRSQPPFFSHMLELLAGDDDAIYQTYLPELRKEHAYWMQGRNETAPGSATRHVVKLADGSVLNRYWDARETPRSESYFEDSETARGAQGRLPAEVYRDLRAAAESGWDFSSRWLGDDRSLLSIRTTSIIPVDLNSLLFHLEISIVKGCTRGRDLACIKEYGGYAERRARAIDQYLWNDAGYYGDYDFALGRPRDNPSAAMLYPLFVGLAAPERAESTAAQVRQTLLRPGGLATTTFATGQQWDAPNGWAPLQWIAVVGLRRYAEPELAEQIGKRFLGQVTALYARSQKLVEKYVVDSGSAEGGGGGEYPLQDGFGWTNGVSVALLRLYGHRPLSAFPTLGDRAFRAWDWSVGEPGSRPFLFIGTAPPDQARLPPGFGLYPVGHATPPVRIRSAADGASQGG
jgi:alpha,alpha-trehalase